MPQQRRFAEVQQRTGHPHDLWAYESEKRAALDAWSEYIRKTAAIDDKQLSLDLIKPAA